MSVGSTDMLVELFTNSMPLTDGHHPNSKCHESQPIPAYGHIIERYHETWLSRSKVDSV